MRYKEYQKSTSHTMNEGLHFNDGRPVWIIRRVNDVCFVDGESVWCLSRQALRNMWVMSVGSKVLRGFGDSPATYWTAEGAHIDHTGGVDVREVLALSICLIVTWLHLPLNRCLECEEVHVLIVYQGTRVKTINTTGS